MMTDEEIKSVLQDYRIVASVGLSADETKDSFAVGVYLQRAGYHIIPINPKADHILGQKVYRSLIEIPAKVEMVQVFRPANEAPDIVEQAIQIGARAVWMQLGIANEEAAEKARAAGLRVVMDHCMMQEHRRLLAEMDTL
jgi:predicted CoA-binding protein